MSREITAGILLYIVCERNSYISEPQGICLATTMFGLRTVAKSLPLRNAIAGSQFLVNQNKTALRLFGSGVEKSIDRHGTTILVVRKDGKTVMAGDGQVSAGSSVVKGNAKKVRRLGDNILVGFAGSTADALTLLERLEKKLEEHPGQLTRACVELAKAWRSDKYLRRLEVSFFLLSTLNTSMTAVFADQYHFKKYCCKSIFNTLRI